ncbi:MAG: tyrosine-type recombinase/integrase [Bacteroidetes bacterium]|nr:tyrosine-type recombinase/integrase [Bacteroidota bacterium]
MKSRLVHHQGAVQAYLAYKGKRLYYNTGVKAPSAALDKDNFVKPTFVEYANKLNETIMTKKAEFDDAILKDLKANGDVDLLRVKSILYATNVEIKKTVDKDSLTLDEVLNEFTSSLIKLNRGRKWRYELLHKILKKHRRPAKEVSKKEVAEIYDEFKTGVNANTAHTRLKDFKKFYKWAREEGYALPRVDWDEIAPKTFKPDFVYLDDAKLQQLKEHVGSTPHLERVRQIFMVLCHTAMRYSEYHSLKKEEVIIKGEEMYVDKVSHKTKTRFIVPVTDEQVQKILKNPPKMVGAVFNRSVRELGKELKWEEVVRFRTDTAKYESDHFYNFLCSSVGRHTAATSWAIRGADEYDAMQWAGWSTPTMFRYYQNRFDITNSFKKMKELIQPVMKIA